MTITDGRMPFSDILIFSFFVTCFRNNSKIVVKCKKKKYIKEKKIFISEEFTMATWRIGIDEFGLFNALDPNDHSFVCAVITKKEDVYIKNVFKDIYKTVEKKSAPQYDDELLKEFHGSEQPDEKRNLIFREILRRSADLYDCIVLCKEKPSVFANNQQWWISSILGIVKKICDLDIVSQKDSLNISIDCRNSLCLGLLSEDDTNPEESLKTVTKNIANWEIKKESIKEEDFDVALDIAYRVAAVPKLRKDAFNAMLRLIAMNNLRETTKLKLDPISHNKWWEYHKKLQKSLRQEIKQIFPGMVNVNVVSSSTSYIVSLADQICGIEKDKFFNTISGFPDLLNAATPILANVQNLSYGQSLEACVRDGDYLEACDILLFQVFNGKYENKGVLNDILSKTTEDMVGEIWRKVFYACEMALNKRGLDGNAIQHVKEIFPILKKYSDDIPNFSLRISYLKIQEGLVAHSGEISNIEMLNIEELLSKNDCGFERDTDKWNFYVETSAILSQIHFNAYDFGCVEIENLLKTQEQFASIKYPFSRSGENYLDENAAMLYGTIGQAEAFKGNFENAIKFFEKDFKYASAKTRNMPASFLTVVYHRQENLEKAVEWFEKESNTTFKDFGMKISAKTDQWLILNYFRLYALSLKKGIKDLPEFPAKELWSREGWYPWPLLLKWAAYSLMELNRVDEAIDFLQESQRRLIGARGFTVNSLALAPLAMLVQISKKYKKDDFERYQLTYRRHLEWLCEKSSSFAMYVGLHLPTSVAEGDCSLWEAAMILPFNYS